MNIFYLDKVPARAAEMHCDKHVVKMITEYAQLLSTAHRVLDGTIYTEVTPSGRKLKRYRLASSEMDSTLYKATHVNHPSAVWVRQSSEHYIFLYTLYTELSREYTRRYGKIHKAYSVPAMYLAKLPNNIPRNVEFVEPPPAMPDHCKIPNNIVESYRQYYIQEKNDFATWKNMVTPSWYTTNGTTN